MVTTCLIAVDIHFHDVSPSHTFRSALDQYLALNVLEILGWIYYLKMLRDTKRIADVQEKTLLDFLKNHENTDYGKKFGLQKVKSVPDFIQRHPLTTYEDIKPYIDRMQEGETQVFTMDQPKIFAVTSGTSGHSSVLPFLKTQQRIFFLRGITIMSCLMSQNFPGTRHLRKVF